MFDIDTITEEAEKRFRQWKRGVRGQMIYPQDGIEFWYALVGYELGHKDQDEPFPA